MNRVQLIGVLVWPVDVWRDRVTGRTHGKAMIVVSSGVEGLDFVPVILNDREALDAAAYLGEGSRVEVVGRLHSAVVTLGSANKRTRRTVSVIAERVTYLVVCPPRSGERQ